MQFDKSRTNYSVDSIERSIVMDNPVGAIPVETKKELHDAAMEKLDKFPELKKILDIRHLHTYPVNGVKNFARVGIIPSKIVISDERIKDMCRNTFWHSFGHHGKLDGVMKFTRCPSLDIHSSCPYYSLSATEVRKKLDKADIFVGIQSKFINDTQDVMWMFHTIAKLSKDIGALLGEEAIVQKFGSGPCQACMQECLGMGECRNPKIQVAALESQGVAVGQLCRDIALLTGNKSWHLTFIKHFGLPNMTPRRWKFVIGLAIKLPDR